jgi:DNA-binding response OmpR family regulator
LAETTLEERRHQRILVVDDEDMIRRAVRITCETEGYTVAEANSGDSALVQLAAFSPDIVLLDLVLPDKTGFEVCREIRRTSRVPILILSAKSDEIDVVVGLEIGADDYILKPFRPRELLARIASHLRKASEAREEAAPDEGRMVFRGLIIDVGERRAYRDGAEVDLTHTEFDLVAHLAAHPGKALSRDSILKAVWGYEHPVETRVIDVHVRNVRRKLEADPSHPFYILAVPGIGYRFTAVRA